MYRFFSDSRSVTNKVRFSSISAMEQTPQQMNFYRRKLPPTCIDFASDEGKKLFTESLLKGLFFFFCKSLIHRTVISKTFFAATGLHLQKLCPSLIWICQNNSKFFSGSAEIYFRLAPHFLTQGEPSYCGLSTLGKSS